MTNRVRSQRHPAQGWLSPRRGGQIALGLLLSALLLWLTLRRIDMGEVGQALQAARWGFLIPAVLTYFLDLGSRSWRWSVLLRPVKRFTWRDLYSVVTIGYMGNMLLPARLGELVRVGVLHRRGVAASAALGSIATERVLDGLTTVGILLIASGFLPRPAWLAAGLTTVTVLFVGALLALGLLLAFRPVVIARLVPVAARFPRTRRPIGWMDQFLDGLGALRNPRLVASAIAIGLLAWTFSMLEYYWVFRAFALPVGFVGTFFAVSAVGLSTAIPSAPGYVGAFEFAGVAVLGALGVASASAFSAVVLLHLLQIVPVTVAGLFCAWREGLSLTPR